MKCGKILIVEDDPAIRSMMQDILEIEGYQVQVARDGASGISALQKNGLEFCVVLLDLMMPDTHGWWFLDQQRADPVLSKIPVVICSAYEESARSVKPSGFIPKPIQLNTLIESVKEFCG